jgi:hypothetical protein
MNNQHEETKKIVTGLLIGVVGAGALYCMYAAKHKKIPLTTKIGRTISDIGEMIQHCNFKSVTQAAESIEQKLPKGTDVLNNLSEWASLGMSLWKKLK